MAIKIKTVQNFFNNATHPLKYEDILEKLSIPESGAEEFSKLLEKLIQKGKVVKIKGDRYGTPEKMNLVLGRVQAHKDGYGFIIPEDDTEEDLFVNPRQLREVMHNDMVIARRQTSRRSKKSEGKIIRVVERGNTNVIGKFERKKRFGYLVPLNQSILHDIYISLEDSMDAPDGIVASAQITKYPIRTRTQKVILQKYSVI